MRISPLFRLTALWALLVFAAGWSEDALVLHPCPHHAAIAHAAAADAGHAGAHHAAATQPGRDDHGAPAHSGPCSCVVACAGTAFALAAPRAEARLPEPVFRAAATLSPPPPTALPGRRQHVLPFPTAPPRLPS